jgi:hypothetical protein
VKQRWVSVALLAAGLFVINVIARLVVRFAFDGTDAAETNASVVMFALVGLALAVATFVRAQRVAPSEWSTEMAAAALGAMLLTILVGPFVSGSGPFEAGAGSFFLQIWLYGGFAIAGVLLGFWVATALGRDYRSRSLSAYTRASSSKPRRTVRR